MQPVNRGEYYNVNRQTGVRRFLFAALLFVMFALAQLVETSAPAPAGSFSGLDGRVTDPSGRPLRKVGLTLRSAFQAGAAPQSVYSTTTDAEGKFAFDAIRPGAYWLSAERAGYLQKYYRAGPHGGFSTIALTAGQRQKEINVVLVRALTISGRVLDADDDPVASATVRLLRRTYNSGANLEVQRSAPTDESGKFDIPGLSPGEYYLSAGTGRGGAFSILGMRMVSELVSGPPDYYTDTYYPNGTDQHEAKAIQILHEDVQGMDIHLRKTRAFLVRGKVVGTVPGHELEQCQLILTPANLPSVMGPTPQGTVVWIAKDGSFDFHGSRFPPGDYFITAFIPPISRMVLAPRRLRIGNRDIDDAVLNLQPFVELRGSLALEGERHTDFFAIPGTPPPWVTIRVSLSPVNGPLLYTVGSGITNDGAFTIADVAPGAYEVHVSGIAAWVKSIQFGSRHVAGSEIEVTGASGAARLQITLSRSAGQIDGVVETDAGKPAAGSTIILLSDPPGKLSMLTGGQENGAFTLSPVAPGTYRIYAWEDSGTAQDPVLLKAYESKSVAVTVKENGRVRVTLRQIPSSEPGEY